MSTMNTLHMYEELINNTLRDKKQTLYVFQGFPFSFYQAVQNVGLPHLCGKKFESYIDYNMLDPKKEAKALLIAFMSSEETTWLFYEEFIALTNVVINFDMYSGDIVIVKNNLFDNYYPIPVAGKDEIILTLYENDSDDDLPIFHYYSDCKRIDGVLYYSYINRHFEIDTGKSMEERNFFPPTHLTGSIPDSCESVRLASLKWLTFRLQAGKVKDTSFLVTEHSSTLLDELSILNTVGSYFNVTFYAESIAKKNIDIKNDYVAILKKYWGKDSIFRTSRFYEDPGISSKTIEISQGEIITDVIEQCLRANDGNDFSDLIVTAPTGAGKSVLFQIPAIYLSRKFKEITIVVCPLVALMVDQVRELSEKGVANATFINSSITFEERKERLEGIKNGKYSIVYLSPELLLSMDIRSLIGDRKVGLIVVDEAHLVTSWGRDFRVDYWFLGDYIEKIRHGSYYSKDKKINVPVFCLTATAVFGGQDDVIDELQASLQLNCNEEQLYIGYVKRDNIIFDIRHPQQELKSDKKEKILLTIKEFEKNTDKQIKTIAYFPFRSSISETEIEMENMGSHAFDQIVKYHGGEDLGSIEKDHAYKAFKNNEKIIMMATKAFGMGVNVPDIQEVYHYAPTGTLADYVQEIGRAARSLSEGYATTDFLPQDMHYAKTLWGLSGLRHYQLQEMMKKIYEIHAQKKRRNMLISPDTFNYLFDSKGLENKVKSGLMLLSSDLSDKYHFKVIAVRAKSLFSKQFITVLNDIEQDFVRRYNRYCIPVTDVVPRHDIDRIGKHCLTLKMGTVYEMNLSALWENEFSEKTFAKFKWEFFNGKLFDYKEQKIVPNVKLIIRYKDSYEKIKAQFDQIAKSIQDTFNKLKKTYGGREFTLKSFEEIFCSFYGVPIRKEYIMLLLDLFCFDHVDTPYDFPTENWKFVKRKKSEDSTVVASNFCIYGRKPSFIGTNLRKYFTNAAPNDKDEKNVYKTYLPIVQGEVASGSQFQLLASVLQLFGLASYEIIGGRNPEIFVRINDPQKLEKIALSQKKYYNRILKGIERRHQRAIRLMNQFMGGDFSNEERWEIIEEYFLGNDEKVELLLESRKNSAEKTEKTKSKHSKAKQAVIRLIPGVDFYEDYKSWSEWEESSMVDATEYIMHHIMLPKYHSAKIVVNSMEYDIQYAWEAEKVLITEEPIDKNALETLQQNGWYVYAENDIDFVKLTERLGE